MDKSKLKARRLGTGEVQLPGWDEPIPIRSLSQAQAEQVSEISGTAERNRYIVRYGVVTDEPLTDADVDEMRDGWPAGDFTLLCLEIAKLSGLLEGSAKEAYKSLRGES